MLEQSLSKKYQWLPSEFIVDTKGEVKIDSYINNLHPIHHSQLYACIGKIFQQFLPLFKKVLTDLSSPRPNRLNSDLYALVRARKREKKQKIPSGRERGINPTKNSKISTSGRTTTC